jgi:DNA-binding NarL/FixJ family response regulator
MIALTVTSPLLSPRQEHVFYLLGSGMNTKQIASDIGVTVKTVEAHYQVIQRKTKIHGMKMLVQEAVEYFLSLEQE